MSASSTSVLQRLDTKTSKGIQLHVVSGPKSQSLEGVFVFTHGYSEHSGRYLELAQQIVTGTDHSWACIVYDVRGHGDSPGVRGFIANFDEYLVDLDEIVRLAETMSKRIVLCGHSNGGLITLRWLTDRRRAHLRSNVQASVLCAPFLQTFAPLSMKDALLVRVFSVLAPQTQNPFEPGFEVYLTHDEGVQQKRREDQKCFNASTLGWFHQAQLTQARVKKSINKTSGAGGAGAFPIKTYWFVPGQDVVCNPEMMKKAAKKLGGTVFEYPDLFHELFLESNRKELIDRVVHEVLMPLSPSRASSASGNKAKL